MHRAWICAAVVLASSAAAVPVASATGRPIVATVSSCIATWNVAPPAAATIGHVRRTAVVQPYASGTGAFTWTRTTSGAIHGPACKVEVIEPSGRALVIYTELTTAGHTAWKRFFPSTVKPEPGQTANALIGSNGLLRSR
jgi:hypothetical protein